MRSVAFINKRTAILLLAGLLIVLLFSSPLLLAHVYQLNIPPMVNEMVKRQSELLLEQVASNYTQSVLQIDRAALKLNLDNGVRALLLEDEFILGDWRTEKVQMLLRDIQTQNPLLHSAFVFYSKQQVAIAPQDILPVERMALQLKEMLKPAALGEYRITGAYTLQGAAFRQSDAQVLSILRFFPVYTSERYGAVVLNVRVSSINFEMMNIANKTGGYVFMINGNGTIECASDVRYIKGSVANLLDTNKAALEGGVTDFQGKKYHVYLTRPNYFGLRLMQLYPVSTIDSVYQQLTQTAWIMYASNIFAVLMIGTGSYLLIRQMNRQQVFENRLAYVLEDGKTHFAHQLFYAQLHESRTLTEKEKELCVKYQIPESPYGVIVYEKMDSVIADFSAIMRGATEFFSTGVALRWSDSRYTVMIYIPKEREEDVDSFLITVGNYLIQQTKNEQDALGDVFIYPLAVSLVQFHEAHEKALSARDIRWITNKECGIYVYKKEDSLIGKLHYPTLLASQVLELIKGMQAEEAIRTMHQVIDTICRDNRFSPAVVKEGVARFVSSLEYDLGRLGGVKPLEMMMSTYLGMKRLSDVHIWLATLIQQACDDLLSARGASSRNIEIDEIKAYIGSCLTLDISLASVSQYFSLSESYFSRLFKQKQGENFLEYVNRQRVLRAKALLANGTSTINEVARLVGFTNAQTFIRVFKSIEGITPGTYQAYQRQS